MNMQMKNSKLSDIHLKTLRKNETRLFKTHEALYVLRQLGYFSTKEWCELATVRHGATVTVEVTQQLSVLALLAEGYDVWSEGDLAEFRTAFNSDATKRLIFYNTYADKYMSAEDYQLVRNLWVSSRKEFAAVRQMFAGFLMLSEGYDV